MQGIINRHLTGTVKRRLKNNPVVAILGPRQCGKTTLAGQIVKKMKQSVYLDCSGKVTQFFTQHGYRSSRNDKDGVFKFKGTG